MSLVELARRVRVLPLLLFGLCLASPLPGTAQVPRTAGAPPGGARHSALTGQPAGSQGVPIAGASAGRDEVSAQGDGEGEGDAARSSARLAPAQVDRLPSETDRLDRSSTRLEAAMGTAARMPVEPVESIDRGDRPPVRVLASMPADWHALLGERVRIEAPLTLVGTDRRARHGELLVAFGGRLWQPSERAAPGTAEYVEIERDNARRQLVLDEGGERDPSRAASLPGASVLRTGMQLAPVEGVVERGQDGAWRLRLTEPLQVPPLQRPAPPRVRGRLRVAAFNLENFFNGDGRGAGFPTARGARTPAELQAQLRKLVATIRALDADIAALMELENDGYGENSAIATLVSALNDVPGRSADWRYVDAGHGPGDNPIRVGLIYRASRVLALGEPATLETGPYIAHSRVPLAQAFRSRHGGRSFVVVANHFKSKGCTQAQGADADQGDGQACWNATRVDSARRLDAWLRSDPTHSGGQRIVLLGDFNAYAMEAPLRELRALGWRDAFALAGIDPPYSYVYGGRIGRLDHGLLSADLAPALRGAAEWHSNADEQEEQGYRSGQADGPWRSSDHDPLLLGLDP